MFPAASAGAGMYESFFLRTYCPQEPVGVWIRYTVEKRPGHAPSGSLWCTVFDARRGAPRQERLSGLALAVPADGWIAVGAATIGADRAEGDSGGMSWSLGFSANTGPLAHLSPAWLYRAPLPRTKLTSPAPWASFEGVVELGDGRSLELDGWPGMVGHNWGSEHAERWIWLHGLGFEDRSDAWLDLALGRVALAGRTTPWRASGALSVDGVRHRLGALTGRAPRVAENPEGCDLQVAGPNGLLLAATVTLPADAAARWRYEDPAGGQRDVVNCSVAALEGSVRLAGEVGPVALLSAHGVAYELGVGIRAAVPSQPPAARSG